MRLKIKILNFILNILKPFAFGQKVRAEVLFVSLENAELTGNFKLISDELTKRGIKCRYHLLKFDKSLIGYAKYFTSCIRQLFMVNRAKMVIIDFNNYICCNYKRPETKVFELWHASGCIKRFGNETDRDYVIKGYDYILAAAESFKPFYSMAFNVPEDSVKVLGIPITDEFFDEKKKNDAITKFNARYNLSNKKVILYAPTFRGRLMKGFKGEYLDVNALISSLPEDYVIMYKMHPLMQDYVLTEGDRVINVSHESLTELFYITDYLISDYSALIFDFSVFNKPMIFYVPDIEEYRSETGLFIDYENEMPGPIVKDESALRQAIVEYPEEDLKKVELFKDKYATMTDGKSLDRVVDFITDVMKG
ncbi:MAG: CDP-glycerol glycerophosphotransferase family protein [Lachnospiraceae bacterium]|nr:CDP-glycerol glycerophosphotransferase family protein [Lachnospiraceae bacterium]